MSRADRRSPKKANDSPRGEACWKERLSRAQAEGLIRPGERLDDLQRGGLVIMQDPERFCFGMDAVLLSDFAQAAAGGRVLDLGTGTGILPLLMSAKTEASHFDALEIQHESADLASRNVRLNDLTDRITIIEGDLREADAFLAPASYDVITCNPPYRKAGEGVVNPEGASAIARHEILCTFEDVARVSEKLLKPGGHFFAVHRPQRLPELFSALTAHRLEPKRMRLCYPRIDRAPDLVLLECVRGGRPRLAVEKPLIIWKEDGTYTDEVKEVYGFSDTSAR